MSNELVSIIIPVYNCEKYISDCLESIISQSYKNIEILIIDDESTDNSVKICDEYAKKYQFIKVVRQKNAGSGFARNKGLDLIKGDFYTFVDADDYISRTFVEAMLGVCKQYDAELAECGNVYMLEARNILRNTDHIITLYDSSQEIKDSEKIHRNTVWGRLYKRDVFGHIRFSNKRLGEDAEYSRKVTDICKKMVHYNYCMYGYRSYQESVTRPVLNKRTLKEIQFLSSSMQEKAFIDSVNAILGPINHRREEKLYQKDLYELLHIYEKASFYSKESELFNELNKTIEKGKCSVLERAKLKIRHKVSDISARYRTIINYKYRLDELN